MLINHLYHTWFQRMQQLRPGQRINQVRNFVWLITGIYQSRSVCLSRIAGNIPGPAKLLSQTRSLSRLLDNLAISAVKQLALLAYVRKLVPGDNGGAPGLCTAENGQEGLIHIITDGERMRVEAERW